ncbi:MAG: 1-(5-phosphoribosyl)-5-[(5-phosphoribosylamino)methylideneamino] imidazole-4-carboxamide isomerase [Spirochaetales bacterium]|jgi:phosphoribosylformimino-5-aminoimidazole carboxamide ribotide isomerase|nr:1-(5-phosphoribosyl)-5-[(5-phosphoribosylamino)methylideneamino] imidazole-4-carboxamide isomerase [Spirochaetales bacterium]
MDLIVAIDLIDGELVRLSKGAYETKRVYAKDPVEVAKAVEGVGLKRLHLVDLDGAKAGKPINLPVLERIARETALIVDVGGGIRDDEDIAAVFDAGAAMANLGSVAVHAPSLVHGWIDQYGADRLILAADSQDGMIKSGGWIDESTLSLDAFIDSYRRRGLLRVTATDINRDGMLSGPAFELYRRLLEKFEDLVLVASGGVSSLEDLIKLSDLRLDGAIIGKALYEGRFTLEEVGKLQERLNG